MMRFTTHRDHRRDARHGTGIHIALAEVSVVRQQRIGVAQFARQATSATLPSIGSSCCLSFGACTTSAAITSRLPAATIACAL